MENYPNSYYNYNPNHNNKPPSTSKSSKNSNHNHDLNNNRGKRGPPKLSTDPQSVAARERRHRISDRFKILQTLVPGGAKLDTVSLLEQAIQYVKFLKAQIWLHQAIINPKHVNIDNDHASIYNNNNNNNTSLHNGDYDCCYCVNDYDTLNDDDHNKVIHYDQSYSYYDLMMHGNDGVNHQGEINDNIIGASQVVTAMETQTATPDLSVGYQMDEGNYDQECLYYKRSLNYY